MSYYIRTTIPPGIPEILQITAQGMAYHPSILHAGTETTYRQDARRRERHSEHAHAVYHVVLFTHGDNLFTQGGQRHPAMPSILTLTSPGERHSFHPCLPGAVTYMEVCFELTNGRDALQIPFDDLLSRYAGVRLAPVAFPVKLNDRRYRHVSGIVALLLERLMQGERLLPFAVTRGLFDLLAFLVQEIYAPQVPAHGPDAMALQRVKEEIEHRYRERLTVEELAEIGQMSSGYLSRAFKRAFQTTPIAYQRELKVQAAKNLLSTTTLSIKEIAIRTGFEDPFFFTKTFVQLAGVPPTVFRRRQRTGMH